MRDENRALRTQPELGYIAARPFGVLEKAQDVAAEGQKMSTWKTRWETCEDRLSHHSYHHI
jgi:hypothetical protein